MSARLPLNIATNSKDSDDENLRLLKSDKSDEGSVHCCSISLRSYVWIWLVILLTIFGLVIYALNPSRDSDTYPIHLMNSGDRIQLKSAHSDLYIRVSDATSSLILDQNIPWKRGSTFEVEAAGECFLLRSLTGNFVRVDSEGLIRSSSQHRYGATHFTAVPKYESPPAPNTKDYASKTSTEVHLKVCKKEKWLQEVSQLSVSPISNSPKNAGTKETVVLNTNSKILGIDSEAGLIREKLPRRVSNVIVTAKVNVKAMSFGKPTVSTGVKYGSGVKSSVSEVSRKLRRIIGLSTSYETDDRDGNGVEDGSPTSDATMRSTRPLLSSFEVISVPQIRGVNLGGWFIPEVWMGSKFFNGTGLGWGGSLCSLVNYSRSLAEERMAEKLSSWITEEDLMEIKAMGFNSVRLPIGYWNVIHDPYARYAPADHRVSLAVIDWCFDTCEKLGLTVLLDLHGAPGSQNGIDHSGCSMIPKWIQPDNVALTLKAIEAMAKRYSGRKNLVGFELLNEPAEEYGAYSHSILTEFYVKSYHIIRKYSDSALVIFNELYAKEYPSWNKDLREPTYFNIVMDWHLYQFQYPHYTTSQHVAAARQWEQTIEEFDSIHPIIVGEWSMGTGTIRQAGQAYVDAAVKSFERSSGWYLWNWKIQPGIGFEEWDVQAQKNKKNGLDPLKAIREMDEENLNYIVKDARDREKRLKIGEGPADLAGI